MAVAAPARRSSAPATAPPPSRRKAPARAPSRKAPARRPTRRATPGERVAAGGRLIPIAAGRAAVAVRELPDSGLVVRMTRGRAWIAVLGVLLVGIVALNVVTLSFAASSGKIDEQLTALEQDNSVTSGRASRLDGIGHVRATAAPLGLAMPSSADIHFTQVGPDDVATAAQRLAAAGPG